ncbi:MAG: hypothetical protein HWE20_10975 [Gammaproteobacteria bacterium]|nr:hypothetical protein [Gammaproteobacteria bacterium]
MTSELPALLRQFSYLVGFVLLFSGAIAQAAPRVTYQGMKVSLYNGSDKGEHDTKSINIKLSDVKVDGVPYLQSTIVFDYLVNRDGLEFGVYGPRDGRTVTKEHTVPNLFELKPGWMDKKELLGRSCCAFLWINPDNERRSGIARASMIFQSVDGHPKTLLSYLIANYDQIVSQALKTAVNSRQLFASTLPTWQRHFAGKSEGWLKDSDKKLSAYIDDSQFICGYRWVQSSRALDIKSIQMGLIASGYLNGKADGILGPMTCAAVDKFVASEQRSNVNLELKATNQLLARGMSAPPSESNSPGKGESELREGLRTAKAELIAAQKKRKDAEWVLYKARQRVDLEGAEIRRAIDKQSKKGEELTSARSSIEAQLDKKEDYQLSLIAEKSSLEAQRRVLERQIKALEEQNARNDKSSEGFTAELQQVSQILSKTEKELDSQKREVKRQRDLASKLKQQLAELEALATSKPPVENKPKNKWRKYTLENGYLYVVVSDKNEFGQSRLAAGCVSKKPYLQWELPSTADLPNSDVTVSSKGPNQESRKTLWLKYPRTDRRILYRSGLAEVKEFVSFHTSQTRLELMLESSKHSSLFDINGLQEVVLPSLEECGR